MGWLWVPLILLVSAPFPLYPLMSWPAFPVPLPERAIPILWLLLAGAAVLFMRVARASVPFALLLSWALVRALWTGLEVAGDSVLQGAVIMDPSRMRPFQVLLLMALAGLLYAAARDLSRPMARWVAWAVVAAMVYEGGMGLLNAGARFCPDVKMAPECWRTFYPGMGFVVADQIGRSMGFLTHPNYWGSVIALGVPVVASLVGAIPALALLVLIVTNVSVNPVISAAAGACVLLWPELGRKARYALFAVAGATTATVLTLHEWRLNGRSEMWSAVWPELIRYPIIGQGLGSWRVWATQYDAKLGRHYIELQAHQEPYQLLFELGLIGLALAGLWVWQIGRDTRTSWQGCPPGNEVSWWRPGRIPLERAWIAVIVTALVNSLASPTFHLPAQAAIAVFALSRIQAHAAEVRDLRAQVQSKPPRHRRKREEMPSAESD